MTSYKIFPLLLSRLYAAIGTIHYPDFSGEKSWQPVIAFLIEGNERCALVDNGCAGSEMATVSPFVDRYEDVQSLEEALKGRGLRLEDITDVIQTHLHADHWLNARKLSRATFWVQQRELEFAMNPHPFFARSFNRKRFEGVKFKTVQGDVTFVDGIELLLTPGHSAGTQSVSIQTEKGKAVIPGFCSDLGNFNPPDKSIEVIPPGFHLDLLESYASALRIKKIGGILLPPHEASLEQMKSFP
jgi:N-acyl homoserine lactone hydrolase